MVAVTDFRHGPEVYEVCKGEENPSPPWSLRLKPNAQDEELASD